MGPEGLQGGRQRPEKMGGVQGARVWELEAARSVFSQCDSLGHPCPHL